MTDIKRCFRTRGVFPAIVSAGRLLLRIAAWYFLRIRIGLWGLTGPTMSGFIKLPSCVGLFSDKEERW